MRGFYGKTSFEFEIERYKDKNNNQLLMTDSINIEDENYEYQIIILNVEGSDFYIPGRYSGPPEFCYEEDGETEILNISSSDGMDWRDLISSKERDLIIEIIQEKVRTRSYYNNYED